MIRRYKPLFLTLLTLLFLAGLLGLALFYWFSPRLFDERTAAFRTWRADDPAVRASLITVPGTTCGDAPFMLPSTGFIGMFYNDPRPPYNRARPHQGIDIFSDTIPGATPVFAAYDGYITRESEWRSALIQRVPQDPLDPERQIWLYYTHMADEEGNSFIIEALPPGTREFFVEQGTLIGYTGNYNGASLRPIWVHLHFSIVRDDGRGGYLSELDVNNTLDPTPYLGLEVGYDTAVVPVTCP